MSNCSNSIMKSLDKANHIRAIYSLIDTVFAEIDLGDKHRAITLLVLLDEKLEPAIDTLIEILENALDEEIARESEKVCGALTINTSENAPQTLAKARS